ncbi:Mitochondrial ribosomal protein S18C [Fasciola gigantica]|uniref:Mitochondrial ribosomal protein S18C n=1 Tax=Fasciola gigantica TaxID=46835 RepID=A0A504Y637_FASGI|nr:Mitochondrial ribosomal protein S18C [Fasciola gigantica]
MVLHYILPLRRNIPKFSALVSRLSLEVANVPSSQPAKVQYETDEPVFMDDPYKKAKKRCFLCEHNIDLDYKNVRLLSQFVSPYTGRIYGRHITGLCIPMQKRVSKLITRSRQFGFMPFESKETVFLKDPRITIKKFQ